MTNDPAFVAATRELRDRWLERVNDGASVVGSAGQVRRHLAMGGGTGEGLAMTALPFTGPAEAPANATERRRFAA